MNAILVDTDVFSYTLKSDSRARLYGQALQDRTLCLSFMTVAELRFWALNRRWGAERRRQLEAAMASCQILQPDDRTGMIWAEISLHRSRLGRPISCSDCWIAASALRYGLPLVTHNAADYAGIPQLQVISHGS